MNKLLRTLLAVFRARRRSRLKITDVGRLTMRVRPTDLDVQRHMNNGVYLSLADLGRFDLLVRSGFWDTMRKNGWYPVVASSTITYRKSLEPWQRYVIESRIVGLDEKAVYIEQRFVVDGEIYAQMFIRGRFLSTKGGIVPMSSLAEASGLAMDSAPVPEWMSRWGTDVALPSTRQPAPSVWE